MKLRNGHVTLIYNEQKILREIIKQGEWRLTRVTTINMHGIVLDSIAITHLLNHFEVVLRAHPQPLGLQQLSLAVKPCESFLQLGFYASNSTA